MGWLDKPIADGCMPDIARSYKEIQNMKKELKTQKMISTEDLAGDHESSPNS